MSIAPAILEAYPDLNDEQKKVIGCLDKPLRVIAGPGSGKTYCIILRTLNILLLGKAEPKEVVLCTFTEKATFEMRDRLASAARKIDHTQDLSELTISTIHGLCNHLLRRHRHKTHLGHNYETLDELTQQLFLFDNFQEIVGEKTGDQYFGKWNGKWTTIDMIRKYFDKICDELVGIEQLKQSENGFVVALAKAYEAYQKLLFDNNRVDFAHLQMLAYALLEDPELIDGVTQNIRYILVDEYQDTNYVQEQLLLKLSKKTNYLCAVGDEDQSIYRFRGGTVRNILEFHQKLPDCETLTLTTNYRSHQDIIKKYDRWMASADWSNRDGLPFRHDKHIEPDSTAAHADYPSIFSIWGQNKNDEANRVADTISHLKENGVIEDYSQVALLLHSVRADHSDHYLKALAKKDIPAFCPRARTYFDTEEIRYMMACFAIIFGWQGGQRGDLLGTTQKLAEYVDEAFVALAEYSPGETFLKAQLQKWTAEIAHLQEGETLDTRPADYLFQLLALEPFATALKNENMSRNLAIFSQLLNAFQVYYHYPVVTHRNRDFLRMSLFNSFFRFLRDGGINEYEDMHQPIPKGYVQVMTIHQAKGLEFPVVLVGSLSAQMSTQKQVDKELSPYYRRPQFEPEARITVFDRMRQHYVAFSRAQNLLVLSAFKQPKAHFNPIWEGLPQWPYVEGKESLTAQHFTSRERVPVKKTYSFTGDIKVYETCPRQYQFFRDYDFTPSRSAAVFFGLLVHQTIEGIHRVVMDGGLDTLDESSIGDIFEQIFRFLLTGNVRPIDESTKKAAFRQVMNYFHQNLAEMNSIVEIEVDVSLEKDNYILSGAVDLILDSNDKLELLDFKTSPRPKNDPQLIAAYERQLCTYAYILEQRHGRRVDQLTLYWTSESKKEDALMTLPYDRQKVDAAGAHFDKVVGCIQAQEFSVEKPPESSICEECDMRHLCRADGTIAATH